MASSFQSSSPVVLNAEHLLPQVVRHAEPLPADAAHARSLPRAVATLPTAVADLRRVHAAPAGRPFIVLIQDAHGVTAAQRNIARALSHLSGGAGGRVLVGMEGARGSFPAPFTRRFADKPWHGAVIDHLVACGFLTGAEAFAATAPAEPLLWGVERAAPYRANVEAYRRGAVVQAELGATLSAARGHLQAAAAALFTPELSALQADAAAYRAGTLPLSDYARRMSGRLSSLAAFPETRRFLAASAMEAALDFKNVEAERNALIRALAARLDPPRLERLARESLAFRAAGAGHGGYYRWLTGEIERAGLRMKDYPVFGAYVDYVRGADGVDAERLMEEMELLQEAAWERLARTPAQKTLARLFEDLRAAEALSRNEFTPADWAAYGRRRTDVAALPGRAAEAAGHPADAPPLSALLQPFEDFYRAAERRNAVLAGELSAALASPGTEKSLAVLIVGGFHTPGLEAELKKAGYAYAVLSPRMEDLPASASAYLDVFSLNRTPLEKALLGEKLYVQATPATAAPLLNEPHWRGEVARAQFAADAVTAEALSSGAEEGELPDMGRWTVGAGVVDARASSGGAEIRQVAEVKAGGLDRFAVSHGASLAPRPPLMAGDRSHPLALVLPRASLMEVLARGLRRWREASPGTAYSFAVLPLLGLTLPHTPLGWGVAALAVLPVAAMVMAGLDMVHWRGVLRLQKDIWLEGRPEDLLQKDVWTPEEATRLFNNLRLADANRLRAFYMTPGVGHKQMNAELKESLTAMTGILQYVRQQDELTPLVENEVLEERQLDIVRSMSEFCLQAAGAVQIPGQTNEEKLSAIKEAFTAHPYLSRKLVSWFEARFSTDPAVRNEEFLRKADVDAAAGLLEDGWTRRLFSLAANLVESTVKTDYFVPDRVSLGLRLDPKSLALFKDNRTYPETPFAAIWVHIPYGGFGMHIRFGDVARGGLRDIAYADEKMGDVMKDVYGLAHTQNFKNVDIPEEGSKGAFIYKKGLNPIAAAIAYTDALMNFMQAREQVVNRGDPLEAVDPLEVGPDESTDAVGGIATARAMQKGLPDPGTFMSAKPVALGGAPHMQNDLLDPPVKGNRVTSQGVMTHADETWKWLGLDPAKGPVTMAFTGGLDGDVGSGDIEIAIRRYGKNAKIVSVVDGSGVAYDPDGLDHEELLRLYRGATGPERVITHFQKSLLKGPRAFVVSADASAAPLTLSAETLAGLNTDALDPEILRSLGLKPAGPLEVKERSAEGLPTAVEVHGAHLRQNMFFAARADMLVPGGGRPRTITEANKSLMIDRWGRPTVRSIVYGANIFTEPSANDFMEDAGIVIVPDEKANSVGVEISSRMEVDTNLLWSLDEMTLDRRKTYFAFVLDGLLENAKRKNWALWLEQRRRARAGQEGRRIVNQISQELSREIVRLKRGLKREGIPLEDPVIAAALRSYFPEFVAFADILAKIPRARLENVAATVLAGNVVYTAGTNFVEPFARSAGRTEREVVFAYAVVSDRDGVTARRREIYDRKGSMTAEEQASALEAVEREHQGRVREYLWSGGTPPASGRGPLESGVFESGTGAAGALLAPARAFLKDKFQSPGQMGRAAALEAVDQNEYLITAFLALKGAEAARAAYGARASEGMARLGSLAVSPASRPAMDRVVEAWTAVGRNLFPRVRAEALTRVLSDMALAAAAPSRLRDTAWTFTVVSPERMADASAWEEAARTAATGGSSGQRRVVLIEKESFEAGAAAHPTQAAALRKALGVNALLVPRAAWNSIRSDKGFLVARLGELARSAGLAGAESLVAGRDFTARILTEKPGFWDLAGLSAADRDAVVAFLLKDVFFAVKPGDVDRVMGLKMRLLEVLNAQA